MKKPSSLRGTKQRGNLPRLNLGFVGLPRAKALAMTAFFHSPKGLILISQGITHHAVTFRGKFDVVRNDTVVICACGSVGAEQGHMIIVTVRFNNHRVILVGIVLVEDAAQAADGGRLDVVGRAAVLPHSEGTVAVIVLGAPLGEPDVAMLEQGIVIKRTLEPTICDSFARTTSAQTIMVTVGF